MGTNIKCTAKSIINIGFIIFNILIILYSLITFDLIGKIITILIFIIPTIYLVLSIINYRFIINNNEIIYTNIFGKVYKYKISDIKFIKLTEDIESKKSISIIMTDGYKIKIFSFCTNFEKIYYYLSNIKEINKKKGML